MVNRPPPKAGNRSKSDEGRTGGGAQSLSSRSSSSLPMHASPRRSNSVRHGLEWSLRSLDRIDTGAQHFLTSFYGQESSSDDDSEAAELAELEDQTAHEIFKGHQDSSAKNGISSKSNAWASMNAPLRIGIVDGRKVVFELKTNVTSKPETSREVRLRRKRHEFVNATRSGLEFRLRFWFLKFRLLTLAVLFLAAFVAMNAFFAALFYYPLQDGCCGDPTMTFEDNFGFCVQTSTTVGYGSFSPVGTASNFLVVVLSYLSMLMNTLFAGLLFTKFVTPTINIQFSQVMVLSNVNGVPCLSVRLGNPDGSENTLTDINVRLTYSFQVPYVDHKGASKYFRQTEELRLLSNRQHGLLDVWTLSHVLDESSPLFGLNFDEHPGDKIFIFTLSVDAVQELTKSTVNVQTEYEVQDILIGHDFSNQVTYDVETKTAVSDFGKMSETEASPVWYPAKSGVHVTKEPFQPKKYGPRS